MNRLIKSRAVWAGLGGLSLALAACSGSSSGGGGPLTSDGGSPVAAQHGGTSTTTDPCKLLTAADVLSVTHTQVNASPAGEVGCVFDDAGNVDVVEIDIDDSGQVENEGKPVSGLGDDSGLQDIAGFPDLSVVKGKWSFTITSTGNVTDDQAIALARIVLSRLP